MGDFLQRASSYCLQIERLMSDLNEREKRIDQMEATQQRTKGKFFESDTHFSQSRENQLFN